MSQDTENFEPLRRLLALKRHEQPPPGYFHHFSAEVIARIKAGETGDSPALGWWHWEVPWLRRLLATFEAKPILAGAFGVAVCGLLVTGVVDLANTESPTLSLVPAAQSLSTPMALANVSAPDRVFLTKSAIIEASATNLITPMPAGALLLDSMGSGLPVERATAVGVFPGPN